MKVKVIFLPYILQVLYVLCFTRLRYQVSVYRTIGPLVLLIVDVDEPSVRICGAYIRAPHVIIKTEHVIIDIEGADQLYCLTG